MGSKIPLRNPNYVPFPKSKRQIAMIRREKSDNSEAIKAKLDRLEKLVGKKLPRIVEQANKEALHDIQKLARKALAEKLKDSRRQLRTGNLQAAIMDDKYSIADSRRLQFLRDELVRPVVPYYRAIEHGDNSQVGTLRPLEFLSNGRRFNIPGPRRDYNQRVAPGYRENNSAVGDRIIGSRERFGTGRFSKTPRRRFDEQLKHSNRRRLKSAIPGPQGDGLFLVRIKNPVPAYHYAETAAAQFKAKNGYNFALNRAIAASGLEAEGVNFVIPGRSRKR